jgi:hypothetical protein
MSNILPDIVNDPDLIVETPPQSDTEEEEEEEEVHSVGEVVGEVVRENIDTDDIFVKQKKTTEPVVAPVKKEKKPRKPMSEEHKAKLKIAREKAMASRKAKAVERKELKELESKANQKKKASKKKELEDIVNDVPPPRPKADIDPDIIQKAIDEALLKNEQLRQHRKAQKKAKIEEEVARRKAEEEIKQMVYPPKAYYGDSGFFSKNVFFSQ